MSQGYAPVKQPYQPPAPHHGPQQSNGWATAGFIVSIVGLFLCGIPSIIGLLLSMIGLTKTPKGFAVAGIAISLLGLIELALGGLLIYTGYIAVNRVATEYQRMATSFILESESRRIGEEWESTGVLPSEVDGAEMLELKTDAYGQPIVYETDGESFTLRSRGEDGTLMTEDDITAGPYDSAEEAASVEPIDMKEFDFEGEFGSSGFEADIQKQIEDSRREVEKMKQEIESEFDN